MTHCNLCLKSVSHYTLVDLYSDKNLDNEEKMSMIISNYDYFINTTHIKDLAIIIVSNIIMGYIKLL